MHSLYKHFHYDSLRIEDGLDVDLGSITGKKLVTESLIVGNSLIVSDNSIIFNKPVLNAAGDGINIENLVSDKILTISDAKYQKLDCNASPKNVHLPSSLQKV